MKFADLKTKTANELKETLKEQEQRLFKLRQDAFRRSLKQVHEIDQVRRTIARIKMLLNDK